MTGAAWPPKVRDAVMQRDGERCILCGRRATNVQHRCPRGKGGTKATASPANGIALCGSGTTGCHGAVEQQRALSEQLGYIVRHGVADPADVPVWYPLDREWKLLDDDGTWRFHDDSEPPASVLATITA